MIVIRDRERRGHTKISWLDSHHTFSFGGFHDSNNMGFGALRVINDDRVAPGGGFGQHSHRDMEIITYVLEGALEHNDSLGNGSVIVPGDVQRMSAGTGITHSEFNASKSEPVHFLQLWIIPETQGIAPSYEQKHFPPGERQGQLRLIGDRSGAQGAVTIHQDVRLYAGQFTQNDSLIHEITNGHRAWLHVARGNLRLNGQELREGDGAAITDEPQIYLETDHQAEVLLFELV
ncbi:MULTISPECIES: pirin family protein [unclassified Methylophaga]|uniref:pirin family protein n=1 Tax=unclassified Methylophaga TaxID=2629249 RepID=UPI000C8B646F|nr:MULTISPECIES: pirin family protein [unclassified Methylophaga]MBN45195.1 quercetin 2,3-dioxygenase [Methylophaga sp.]|tara:strand:- start:94016 stop:94714 length:699 start_codon:yes stop_codon:yes gene_type:complete